MDIFHYQYECNPLYNEFVKRLNINPAQVTRIIEIPFLPIQFFKTSTVKSGIFDVEAIFESSGTTAQVTSSHHVKDLSLYKTSFTKTFEQYYGKASTWCIMGLLPSYRERQNSSLVMMVDELAKASGHPLSGFYLDNRDKLYQALIHNEIRQQPTLLIGVTFALLEMAAQYKLQLSHSVIMETGGMKGRGRELTRDEVHKILQDAFGTQQIHSEYGMTELLSQAYAKKDGLFNTPRWMKVMVRDEDDPLSVTEPNLLMKKPATGLINVIDLANIHSCAFIATDDIGRLHPGGEFEVLGRADKSDIRGCSLMVAD